MRGGVIVLALLGCGAHEPAQQPPPPSQPPQPPQPPERQPQPEPKPFEVLAHVPCDESHAAVARVDDCMTACEAGDGVACEIASDRYQTGHHVDHDPQHALALALRACDLGEGRGCSDVAIAHSDLVWNRIGPSRFEGIEIDVAKSRDYDKRAASRYAAECAGGRYRSCRAANQPWIPLADAACPARDPNACWELGVTYEKAIGVGIDTRRAKQYYDKGCAASDAQSCAERLDPESLAKACELGLGDSCRPATWNLADPARIATLKRRGCDLGDRIACNELQNTSR